MCWTTCKKENLQKKTAKNDIKVIKILLHRDEKFISPYRLKEYHFDKVYGSEIGQPIESYSDNMCTMWNIYEGLHSYSPSAISFVSHVESLSICIIPIKDVMTTLDYWYCILGAVIFEGVIPSGSEYYENENGEIISNWLKIVSVIAEIDKTLVSSSNKIQALNESIHNL